MDAKLTQTSMSVIAAVVPQTALFQMHRLNAVVVVVLSSIVVLAMAIVIGWILMVAKLT